jgi:XTP/dITP diphosphohydrolase
MQLVFATHNQNKVNEIRPLIPEKLELLSLNDIHFFNSIEESADTLEGNSLLKANTVKLFSEKNCFADDTGLEVAYLNGAPGVLSSRYSGEDANDADNVKKLLYEMRFATERAAQFRTVITLFIDDTIHVFEGIVKGKIAQSPIGTNGFGYDPVFIPDGYTNSFAELTLEEKNKISHRALAFGKMITFLRAYSLK